VSGMMRLDVVNAPLEGINLIEANAGTGKTWTIAALYVRLVLGHGGADGFVRPLMPPKLQESFHDLEIVCEERRQLLSQKKLHRWLHGWLLVHVPLSYAILVLGAAHAVGAVRF